MGTKGPPLLPLLLPTLSATAAATIAATTITIPFHSSTASLSESACEQLSGSD